MSDSIDRQKVLATLDFADNALDEERTVEKYKELLAECVKTLPPVENKGDWIPVKYHRITDEERERECYPREWIYLIDCKMPDDGQQILITTKGGFVEQDECYYDGYLYSLDSGEDWADVIAWMPSPGPYKAEN